MSLIEATDHHFFPEEDPPLLRAAIQTWSSGYQIPTDHWFELAEQGYDMTALEAKYLHI